jgi:hypothetical protein
VEGKAIMSVDESTRSKRLKGEPYGVMGILERIFDPKVDGFEGRFPLPPEAPSPLLEGLSCVDDLLGEGDGLSMNNRRNCVLFILSVDRSREFSRTCLSRQAIWIGVQIAKNNQRGTA